MLPAKKLWHWHKAKQAMNAARDEWQQLEEKRSQMERQVRDLETKSSHLPAPSNPDEEIAKLLLEQELWMMKKDQQEQAARWDHQALELQQSIQELQFEILALEQELDEEFLSAYIRLSETKANPIVEVRNKACMGCFRPLSLRKVDEWRRGKGPVFCDECDRLLV
ncbi:hypothetical protein [Brevibacillus migulae]|uniref:hypothetical protein n=1 Tax=Brevibacillus migulae TaxID=1644114 RepID=UPI00106EFE3D|nr:hypothetical protein [Brevibacillus migulae]